MRLSGIIPTLVGTIPLFSRSADCKKTTEEVVIRKLGEDHTIFAHPQKLDSN